MFDSCRYICPSDFKYEQRIDGDACVYSKDNSQRVRLNALPRVGTDPASYTREQRRFESELATIRDRIRKNEQSAQSLQDLRNQSAQWSAQSGELASQSAAWRAISDSGKAIQDTSKSLRGMRPPTAPSSDLEKERRAISFDLKRSLTFIQVVLFLVVLSLLAYLVMPTAWAHSIVFLLLCVGVAVGFFLRN